MNKFRFSHLMLVLVLAGLILAGCLKSPAEPTPTSTPIPPTATPTPLPPTATPTTVPPTPTLTAIPPTPIPTAKSLIIKDQSFKPEDCQSSTVLEINDVKGESFGIMVKEGTLSIRGGRLTIWCKGIEHIWIGKLSYGDHTFDSSADDPLRFLLVADGYKYVGGTGTVTLPDGTQVTLP